MSRWSIRAADAAAAGVRQLAARVDGGVQDVLVLGALHDHLLPPRAEERHVHGLARALLELALGQVDGVASHLVRRADDEGGRAAPRGGLGRERPARKRDAAREGRGGQGRHLRLGTLSARREECRGAR